MGINEEESGHQGVKDQNKVYRNAVHRVDLEASRIATTTYLAVDVVESGIKALFQAISDLTFKANDLMLNFDIANVELVDRRLTVHWNHAIYPVINSEKFENIIKESRFKQTTFYRGEKTASGVQPTPTYNREMIAKQQTYSKTIALGLLSNDFNSIKKK